MSRHGVDRHPAGWTSVAAGLLAVVALTVGLATLGIALALVAGLVLG